MEMKQIIGLLLGLASAAFAATAWAEPHHGGGSGPVSIGHAPTIGGRPGFVGRPPFPSGMGYYYSRGTHFVNSRPAQLHSPVNRSPSFVGTSRGAGNSPVRQFQTPARRPGFNSIMGHVAERHGGNWHSDWDRRHAHFGHHRFFVFVDGFWCGLDSGFFPWDYYPYYAYDYYPYDYYPGYYADVEPNYYSNDVYSDEPMSDPTVTTVQTQLTQLGYYSGPVDGIFGPTTRDAVAKYQIANNLDVTGSLSPDTVKSLGLPAVTPS